MTNDTDEKFFKRADAHIHLANEQLSDAARGKVSASLMFAASRFNAWSSASDLQSKEEMQGKRDEVIDYFMSQYRSMLEENLDNYIEHFDAFMTSKVSS
jgi:hypothetical protein